MAAPEAVATFLKKKHVSTDNNKMAVLKAVATVFFF